ncbi:methyl-accepting chemotaxis protein, partial [Vibrio campbellii]|uniref:methyl-accepting chemotaxis protein n=6 Tax=Vibrio campbellii TaxID=680 RepID=UPI002023B717
MIHFLRFSIVLFVLCFSNLTFALEAYVSYRQMTGCGSTGEWVDPNQVNACFMKHDYIRSCTFQKVTYANARYPYQTVCDNSLALSYSEVRCPANSEFDPSTLRCKSQCEYGANPDGSCMDACQFKQSTGDERRLQWLAYVYGEQVTGACYGDFGATRCELSRIPNDSTLCTDVSSGEFTQNTLCHGNFQFTGNQCDGGTLFWGTNGPDEPIIPTDPTHDPDDPTGPIEDPSVLPDDSTNTFNKPDVEDEPDVEEPDTDESTDTAVVSAITGLNKDINTALHDLNSDINETQGAIVNELIAVKGSLVDNTQATQEQQINDNKIYNNTKALIQQANGDITTAVNKSTNATKGVREDLQGLGDSIGELGNSLDGIEELLKGSGFNSPYGDDVPEQIFASSDFIAINE